MTINCELTNEDYLVHQLYTSSKSKSHINKRFRSRIIVPIVYLLLALFLVYAKKDNRIGFVFVGVGFLWFLLYPMYSKWRYERHYRKHIEEHYKNRNNIPTEIVFGEGVINATDATSQTKINGTEVKELIELKDHFLIKLKTDLAFILPKHSIGDIAMLKSRVTHFGAVYVDDIQWAWK
ncbi:MAG: hypothetical protein ACI828_002858 [Flavobacteriales bacterium]